MKNLTNRFFTFANGLYTMYAAKSNMKDGRKSPQISPSVIFLSLILMVLFKKRSLLKLDQFMRTDAAKRFLGRGKPKALVAVSDTTITRSLSTYPRVREDRLPDSTAEIPEVNIHKSLS